MLNLFSWLIFMYVVQTVTLKLKAWEPSHLVGFDSLPVHCRHLGVCPTQGIVSPLLLHKVREASQDL